MKKVHYDVVNKDGTFSSLDRIEDFSLDDYKDDFYFLVEKKQGYSCATYAHYKARIIDASGHDSSVEYRGYRITAFEITGPAYNHQLRLHLLSPDGAPFARVFQCDISYNHPGEGFSRIRPEWDIPSQYQVMFEYIDKLIQFGHQSFDVILELERKAYANDVAYMQEKDSYENYRKRINRYVECVETLVIPDGWTDIPDWSLMGENVKRVFLPASIRWIGHSAFSEIGKNIESVFCFAPKPPSIIGAGIRFSVKVTLYVPKDYLPAYQNNADWSKAFPVIRGL